MVEGSSSATAENLGKIEHVVVLMLENRSFDHMLGYLSLEGGRADVNGLRPGMKNSYGGKDYPVHRLTETRVRAKSGLKGREVADPDPGLVMGCGSR
jgi:phospholipase C